MAEIIPLQAVPNQSITVPLAGQSCDLNVYQLASGLYIDVFLNGQQVIVLSVICQHANRIVRDLYLGFAGDLAFFDTAGSSPIDPDYTGLGSRFQLVYIEASELPPGIG